MGTENMNGKMVKFIKVNGLMDSKADLESGEVQKETLISVNGKTARLTDTEYTLGSTATDIRANSSSVSNMDKESKSLPMVILTAVLTKTASLMAMESTFGVTVAHTRVSSKKVSETVKESGKNQLIPNLILTMVNSSTKKNQVMVFLLGQTAVNTWEILKTI
jgi:hypothetical protein